jgi:hypothetical protein
VLQQAGIFPGSENCTVALRISNRHDKGATRELKPAQRAVAENNNKAENNLTQTRTSAVDGNNVVVSGDDRTSLAKNSQLPLADRILRQQQQKIASTASGELGRGNNNALESAGENSVGGNLRSLSTSSSVSSINQTSETAVAHPSRATAASTVTASAQQPQCEPHRASGSSSSLNASRQSQVARNNQNQQQQQAQQKRIQQPADPQKAVEYAGHIYAYLRRSELNPRLLPSPDYLNHQLEVDITYRQLVSDIR